MEELVGKGSFSVVYKATWRRQITVGKQQVHAIQVAVKMSSRVQLKEEELLSPSPLLTDELARDLAVISGLPHQNILTLHGVCDSTKKTKTAAPKIVYELMTTDLAQLITKHNTQHVLLAKEQRQQPLFPTQMLLRVLRDVSAGLAHLHAHGVVHRDVKPANVLLRDDQVKLCDFGSSRDLQHTIQQMTVCGTLDYMAPEVLNREPAGRPADAWSFGVLLFECVTGKPCARKATLADLTAELRGAGCLPPLVQLFLECHQHPHEPSKRPSMSSIHSRLQRLVMQEASDSQRLKEELKRAEAQDKEAYDLAWHSIVDDANNQPHGAAAELLEYVSKQNQNNDPTGG